VSDKAKKKGKSSKKRGGMGAKGVFFLVILCITGVIFMPTSILLIVGMLPSLVALFVSGTGRGSRASTVAAMNIAGCVPFVFKLWSGENDFASSIAIITDVQAVTVMYTAAAFGYMIDWLVTGLVSSFLYQKGVARMKAIKERQKVLIENWGEEVAGKKAQKKGDTTAQKAYD